MQSGTKSAGMKQPVFRDYIVVIVFKSTLFPLNKTTDLICFYFEIQHPVPEGSLIGGLTSSISADL